uniref:Guanine nucleotide-binding protein-like 1 n=1 Tax=Lygus hesperus TaxID=30085 RepID=A0A0A9XMT7_LYGHE
MFSTFHIQESKDEVEQRIRGASGSIQCNANNLVSKPFYQTVLSIPQRPQWHSKMTAEQLDTNERDKFDNYLSNLYNKYPPERLNRFEQNLFVWRQLWRVLEICDVVAVVVDARLPSLFLPPALHRAILRARRQPVVILTKIDLVPTDVLQMWKVWLERNFVHTPILVFTSKCNHVPRVRCTHAFVYYPVVLCTAMHVCTQKLEGWRFHERHTDGDSTPPEQIQ